MEREYSQKYLQLNRSKKIVFDTQELPFFRVASEFSDLESSPKVESELEQLYPNLLFYSGCVVDGAVLIQDLLPTPFTGKTAISICDLARELNRTAGITLHVADGGILNYYLLNMISRTIIEKDPLIIFPGEGARTVSGYLKKQATDFPLEKAVFLPCNRKPTGKGKFAIEIDFSPLPNNLGDRPILIIDDVVSTGATMQTIAKGLRAKYGNSQIISATWLFLAPTVKENKNSLSGIDNINITLAAFALKGNYVSRPPINSLSCFVRNGEKYDQVKNNFIERYILEKEAFLKTMKQIKSLLRLEKGEI